MEALKELGDDDHTSKSNSDEGCSPHRSADTKPEARSSSINSQRLVGDERGWERCLPGEFASSWLHKLTCVLSNYNL